MNVLSSSRELSLKYGEKIQIHIGVTSRDIFRITIGFRVAAEIR